MSIRHLLAAALLLWGRAEIACAQLVDAPTLVVSPFQEHLHRMREGGWPSARPVPDTVKQRLAPLFTADVLDRARYTVNVNIVRVTRALAHQPEARAVTAYDLIAFQNTTDTGDLSLWANQLLHVRSYQALGPAAYAARYQTPASPMEDEAVRVELRVRQALHAESRKVASTPAASVSPNGVAEINTNMMCKADFQTCFLQFPWPAKPGEVVPCTCVDGFGVTHHGTAY